jgi:hypothetical protein
MAASIFISYSHADERTLERLHKHLATLQREGLVKTWYDRQILAGSQFDGDIGRQLDKSDIFIALVSADYLASRYCYEQEFERALSRSDRGEMQIVPVIAEPCDWLSTPLQKFMALPKDGKPISDWTNVNSAYLDVVTGLRRLAQASKVSPIGGGVIFGADTRAGVDAGSDESARRVRLKRDFDVIEKTDFADRTYQELRSYFEKAAKELTQVSDEIRTRIEDMSPTSFTCTIVNRAIRGNKDAHITVHNKKGRRHFGDISYAFEAYAEDDTSNGSFRVEADDYDLYLTTNSFYGGYGTETSKLTPPRAAEWLWNQFVERAGIAYE